MYRLSPLQYTLQQRLQQQKQQHLYRQRRIIDSPQQIRLNIDGNTLINFSSNDYLGLANHSCIIQKQQQALRQWGNGSGASHLICGHSHVHQQLEKELAEFCHMSAALVFSTGYMANLAVLQTLMGRQDTILADKLNHASLLDGAQLSRARLRRYPHCDYQQLVHILQSIPKSGYSQSDTIKIQDIHQLAQESKILNPEHSSKLSHVAESNPLNTADPLKDQNTVFSNRSQVMIVSDAVFSMDGDSADIPALVRLKQNHQSWLMLDDAHGFGVLGAQGRGSLEQQHIAPQEIDVYMATLGKAAGISGAFVAGSKELIDALIQFARPYIYTTAMPPVLAQGARESLRLIIEESWRRRRLHENISYFRERAQQYQLPIMPSDSAIQPLIIGSSEQALALSQALYKQGFLVVAIRPPSVPRNTARLRITLSALHEKTQIRQLVQFLAKWFDAF